MTIFINIFLGKEKNINRHTGTVALLCSYRTCLCMTVIKKKSFKKCGESLHQFMTMFRYYLLLLLFLSIKINK